MTPEPSLTRILNPRRHNRPLPRDARDGFSLPAVLIIVVGMLILAVALLLVTGIERSTARSFVDFERAGLAVRAGFEELQDVLIEDAMNDQFVVLGAERGQATGVERTRAPYLFIARPHDDGPAGGIRYEPLFSHHRAPSPGTTFETPSAEAAVDDAPGGSVEFTTLPYQEPVRASWVYLTDGNGRNVARYAYWVEDMQGRLDASKAGNADGEGGTHVRAAYPFPAPGVPVGEDPDEPSLAVVALYAIDPETAEDGQGDLAQTLMENRDLMISPGSLLAAAGGRAPLDRDPRTGRLADPRMRAVEESLAANHIAYLERPEIPFAPGIDPRAVGEPKMNLNEMLGMPPGDAVNEMAGHIRRALPEFDDRKGGFPEDYLRTLAANALGYATDSEEPIVSPGEYRGVGAYPLVSEFLMRFRWNDIFVEDGRKYVELTVTTYVELWNMNQIPVSGTARVSYETGYAFPLGPIPEVSLRNVEPAGEGDDFDGPAETIHDLSFFDGHYWFPTFDVSLEPNEYRVINCGTVTYRYDVGGPDVWIPSPLILEGETFGTSEAGYRLLWNGVKVDRAGGGLHRNDSSLNYPSDTAGRPRQRVRTTIPGHSHTRGGSFVNNMGDPRMAWYLQAPQDANAYPGNYSPNRRNIRRGSVYDSDPAAKPKVYGRVLPSEWPDGGHNSPFATGNPFSTTDQRVNPDDPRWFNNLPALVPDDSPQRLSRRGRFFSATELGHVYDPLMWRPTYPETAATNEIRRGFMPTGKDRWPDVLASSPASTDHGGGNTLRVGRPEHPAFDQAGDRSRHAVRLLDLFHAGIPRSDDRAEREGPLVRIDGHVNLNTAGRDALRALAAGRIEQDPRIGRRLSPNHLTTNFFAPRTAPLQLEAPRDDSLADRVADAIIAARPFASPADAVFARTPDGEYVFGNRAQFPQNETIQWSDAAAEELFARVYNNATVRSRNYRVWVVGQALAPVAAAAGEPEVLAESRRVLTIHADPGERGADGSIIRGNSRIRILHESDF